MISKFKLCVYLLSIFTIITCAADEYIVQKGDSLLKVSEKTLGDKSKWRIIADLNKIEKPYSLHIGQILAIPSATSSTEKNHIEQKMNNSPSATSLPNDSDEDHIPYLIWLSVLFISCWLFNSICLRISCWFSLVETTITHCAVFSFIASMIMAICWGITYGLIYLSLQGSISFIIPPVAGIALFLAYSIGMLVGIKRYFNCKWRSIITILIMFIIISNILSFLSVLAISAILPEIMNSSAMQELIEKSLELWGQVG